MAAPTKVVSDILGHDDPKSLSVLALATLCAALDARAPRFPGTRLRVRYAVAT